MNEQFRGENVGKKTAIGVDSEAIQRAILSPKIAHVNEQFRGEAVGKKTAVGMDNFRTGPRCLRFKRSRLQARLIAQVCSNQSCVTL